MKRIDQKFNAYALPSNFFTTDASGALIFNGQCVMAAAQLTFDEMVEEQRPIKWGNQNTTASFLRPHLFNAVVMYWERSGSFPSAGDVKSALDEVGAQMDFGSSWNVTYAFERAASWLLKDYEKRTGDYARRMQKSETYPAEKTLREQVAMRIDLAESRFPETIERFVLPADFFADRDPGHTVLYRNSVARALKLGFTNLYDTVEDFHLLSRARREQYIGEYLKDCFRDVVFAAAERAQEFPTMDAIESAAHKVNCDCGSGIYQTDGESLRLMFLLESEEHYYEMKAAFDNRKLNAHLSPKLAGLPALSAQSKPLL